MSVTAAFVAHEARTQWRSPRFRALSLVYTVIGSAPPAIVFVLARQDRIVAGPALFAGVVDAVQPLLTFILAAVLAVDCVSRERDEGSLTIVSLTPLSNAGYVMRRWIAVMSVIAPVTLAPRIVTAALAWTSSGHVSWAVAVGWLTHALPQLVVGSMLAVGLGTITGRTVLAAIVGGAIFTMGLELANDLLVHVHRNFGGLGALFDADSAFQTVYRIGYAVRGYVSLPAPTEAGVDIRRAFAPLASAVAVPLAVSAVLLAAAPAFLRRSRADLRPWHIPEKHSLRTMLRMFNRWREEYRPDPAPVAADWTLLAAGVATAALLLVSTSQAAARMERHFEEAYVAITSPSPAVTSIAVHPVSARVRGAVSASGEVHTSSILTLRNDGSRPESHFAFAVDPHVAVTRVRWPGRVSVLRRWNRLVVDVDPPLAPGASNSISFEMSGTPGTHDHDPGPLFWLLRRYKRHRTAKLAFDMIDLSRIQFTPAASPAGTILSASSLTPVLRYTPWTLRQDGDTPQIEAEIITPPTEIDSEITLPSQSLVADSCGTLGRESLQSRCTFPLEQYIVFGGPMKTTALAGGARFAFLPAHEKLVPMHAAALDEALAMAAKTWPGMQRAAQTAVVIERPRTDEDDYGWWGRYSATRGITGSGALHLISESLIAQKRPVDAGVLAASIIANTTVARRRMLPNEQSFLRNFVYATAMSRTGGRAGNAVVTGAGLPDTEPIVKQGWRNSRLDKVLRDIEYRVGSDRLVEGIEDFVSAGNTAGTARELLRAIGSRAHVSLDRMYDDYFEGSALPKLTLIGVTFRRAEGRWIVEGKVSNRGTGEAVAPVVLRTAFEPLRRVVRVDGGQEVPFAFESSSEPRAVQIDPERVCYRWAAVGLVDNVEYRSGQ